jgi:signal transduction histidine kinase
MSVTVQKAPQLKRSVRFETVSADSRKYRPLAPCVPDDYTLFGEFMRNPAEQLHVRLGNSRCGTQRLSANEIAGTMSHAIVARRATRGPLNTASGTARSVGENDAPPPDFELGSLRLPFAEDRTLMVVLETQKSIETYPCTKPKTRLATKPQEQRNRAPATGPRFIGVPREITGQNWALRQAQLQMQVRELACANRRKDEFLAMLSHELRSPLSAIHFAVALQRGQMGQAPAQQRTQALIERQLGRMRHLVEQLLDVSRITNDRLHLQCERVDLRVIVNNAIETLGSDLTERNHRLAIELPDSPVWVQADPYRLEQVFVNLVANASRYTDAGGELAVAVCVHAGDGHAVVRIRDSGIGIAPHALAHIFDLFKQANEADPRSKAGLGVGLAVVRKLVELHEGSVTAASAGIGQGSEFTVRLRTLRTEINCDAA